MPHSLDPLHAVAVGAVVLAWAGLFALLGFKALRGRDRATRRAPVSWSGLLLQSLAFALAFCVQRPLSEPLVEARWGQVLLVAAISLLALASTALVLWSSRALGRHWSLEARVREDHELVTSGPYAFVRHPIYTAMGCLLLATGLALSRWMVLLPALLLYALGTAVRVRLEDRLLRAAFGERHAAYAREVPAVVPWVPGKRE